MKRLLAGLVLFGAIAGAYAATPPTRVQTICHEQAVLIEQTYGFFRNGASEREAYDQQVDGGTSQKAKTWIKNMVHSIYSDSRSMRVNIDATSYAHEAQCNRDPDKYIK